MTIEKIDVNEQNTEAYQFYINRGFHAIARDEVDADGKPYPIVHLERERDKRMKQKPIKLRMDVTTYYI